jgi:alpha-glucosidase
VGTWGTGPFDSDGALDFLDALTDRPGDQRHEVLSDVLSRVVSNPDLLMLEFFPDEVVAAAALVAASLPGGERILDETPEAPAAALQEPAPDLATTALSALQLVVGPKGLWHHGWTDEASRMEASQTAGGLVAILRAASRTT